MDSPAVSRPRVARTTLIVCLALIASTLAAYSQVRHFGFLNYDDPGQITRNSHVLGGLNARNVIWAFTAFEEANWFPATWISHMVCYQLFGLNGGLHHLVNVAIHILASLSLFGFLLSGTRQRWPSAFVAFVFALHPLHVESVAWVAERKDVLCALFWFLALWAWVRDAENSGFARYFDTACLFVLGLMSKPMIVTLPFTLILVDFWILHRPASRKTILGKWPFFALSAASSVVTFFAQRSGGAVRTLGEIPFGTRIGNAMVTVWIYIFRTFWPARLAIPYPWSPHPAWQVAAAALAIGGVSWLVLRPFRGRAYLAFGWLWLLGTLLPVIGLIQVGPQSRADRYMYVPMVGLSIAVAWGVADIVKAWPATRSVAAALACAACLVMAAATWVQAGYWRTTEGLFRHTIATTGENYMAYNFLAGELVSTPAGWPEALADFHTALRLRPALPRGHTNIAGVFVKLGRNEEAIAEFRLALRADPTDSWAYDGLGSLLARIARLPEAIGLLRTAIGVDPKNEDARMNLSLALIDSGHPEESVGILEKGLEINPGNAAALDLLGVALAKLPGRTEEAVERFEKALALYPGFPEAHNNLGIVLSSTGRPTLALEQFEDAVRLRPGFADAQRNLGFALLRDPMHGRSEALEHLEAAQRLAPDPALRRALDELERKDTRR